MHGGNGQVSRHRPAALASAAAALVALSGYAATVLIERSAPPVTPPSPYSAPEPSADCGTPELDPVRCPIGGGCPTAAPGPAGTAPPVATAGKPTAGTVPVPSPTQRLPGEEPLVEPVVTSCLVDRAVIVD
ncbi:hypothetical protein RKD22_006207 [Streptomyces pristinaespiralis]